MDDALRFRRRLATRILGLVSVASMALPGACSTSNAPGSGASASTTGTGTTGTTGMGGAGTTGSTGGGGHGGNGMIFNGSGGGSVIPEGGLGDGAPVINQQICFHFPLLTYTSDAGDAGDDAGDAGMADGGPDDGGFAFIGGDNCGPPDGGSAEGTGGEGPCPTNVVAVIADYTQNLCPNGTWEPATILSGPFYYQGDCCCYEVLSMLCPGSGRPYLVEGRAEVAAVERAPRGRGWAEGAQPSLDGLTAEDRASLAQAWIVDALLEHASVASFSRFSLALLAAGAPSDLVELAHRAALDEIQHARLCFALAAGYAGEELGPGRFPVGEEVHVASSLADLAASTVREGCLGETLAAVVAAEQLARATDPAVRAALAQIAEDEARHAELAWRTVAWAVREGGGEVRAAVERAFVEALDQQVRSSNTQTSPPNPPLPSRHLPRTQTSPPNPPLPSRHLPRASGDDAVGRGGLGGEAPSGSPLSRSHPLPRDEGEGARERGVGGVRSADEGEGARERGVGGVRSADEGEGARERGVGGVRSADEGEGARERGVGGVRSARSAHGRLDAATLARIAAGVKAEIVAPSAAALLGWGEASRYLAGSRPARPSSGTSTA